MLRYDCFHLQDVTNNDILETHRGTKKCNRNRAAPDSSHRGGIDCPVDCEKFRPRSSKDGTSAFSAIKDALLAIIGKS